MKFEEKILKLEKLINDLEAGNVSLEDSIEKYTEAMKLVKECDVELKEATLKVNKVVKENGTLADFEATE
ncbi:MAG: exodeoxyribonuclease VII small subunit [Fusobacteriaceae bacterium]|nr:exodeoxyribonuclease VII small subunit [Fusobacteriaceae bacterium]